MICHSLDDARFFWRRWPDAVLQELLLPEDEEVTCAIYRSADGRIGVLQMLRKLMGGLTGWAQIIEDGEIRSQCEQLAKGLELRGSINAQLRRTPEGPQIFELNPRFSSTVLMRHMMGFTDVVWSILELLDKPISVTVPPIGMIAVRIQSAALFEPKSSVSERVCFRD